MLVAYGWCRVTLTSWELAERSAIPPADGRHPKDRLDALVEDAEDRLFDELESLLRGYGPADLDWHFRRHMNNDRGLLLLSSSTNHRGSPSALEVLRWIGERSKGSCGLVHLHDDEDIHSPQDFRVWRLRNGVFEELEDRYGMPIDE